MIKLLKSIYIRKWYKDYINGNYMKIKIQKIETCKIYHLKKMYFYEYDKVLYEFDEVVDIVKNNEEIKPKDFIITWACENCREKWEEL